MKNELTEAIKLGKELILLEEQADKIKAQINQIAARSLKENQQLLLQSTSNLISYLAYYPSRPITEYLDYDSRAGRPALVRCLQKLQKELQPKNKAKLLAKHVAKRILK